MTTGTQTNPILLSDLSARALRHMVPVYVMRNKDRAMFKVWRTHGGFVCEGRSWFGPITTSPVQPKFAGLVSTIRNH